MKRGLLLGGVVLLVLAAAGAAVKSGVLPVPGLTTRHKPQPVMVSVAPITTNLSGADASDFAEVAFTLRLADKALAVRFTQAQPAVLNAVIADLRGESLAQLGGAPGMRRLGRLISLSLDRVLDQPQAVEAVFFTQFVVQ